MRILALLAVFAVLSMSAARPGKGSKRTDSETGAGDNPVIPPVVKPDAVQADEVIASPDAKSRRKSIVHKKPYSDMDLSVELFRETLSRHLGHANAKADPCRYMRCGPGEECDVGQSGVKCVCRRHCKQRNNPLCGTDDAYYDNHCEMHRYSCISGKDIYDARHKDCFYKASECNAWDLREYQDILLQFYRNMMTSTSMRKARQQDAQDSNEALNRRKRSAEETARNHEHKKHRRGDVQILPEDSDVLSSVEAKMEHHAEDEFDISSSKKAVPGDEVEQNADEVEKQVPDRPKRIENMKPYDFLDALKRGEIYDDQDEIMTRDSAGDMVKYIFTFMDLDSNRKVGSDEIWEITSLQHLDTVLPGPCSLFHLLKYGDANNDRTLDISETFKIFNITVFRLPNKQRYIQKPAAYGSPIEMECGIEGEPEPVWHRYGRELKRENGAKIEGRLLHLTDVTARNAGNYTCSARKRPTMAQTIDLQILTAPRVQVHPRTQHPTVTSSSTIKCHAEGRPRPEITWRRNGEELDMKSGRYILLANKTELHFNSVNEDDSAAYSCSATNSAGVGEDVGAIYVQDKSKHESGTDSLSAYFVFHQSGISVVTPHSCQTLRSINAEEKVPGLLRQDKLCEEDENGARLCIWSESVSVGSRFIYAAQPTEDRLVVVDKETQRVVEIITTDVMPVQLFYVDSTDQVFVLCWVDEQRNNSVLQVIHAAGVAGSHFAEHIRPVSSPGRRTYDRSVYDFFIPPETALNPVSQYGYVYHKGETTIYRLDLTTLSYTKTIDLSLHECTPVQMSYLPIGGLLQVTCVSHADGATIHEITIDVETDNEVNYVEGSGMMKQYFSNDYTFAIRLYPHQDMITLHNISSSGKMQEFMIIRTNFQVADTYFVRKKYNPDAMVAYMVAKNQGDVMYVDLEKKKVEIIDGMTPPLVETAWPWTKYTRKLTPSGWFGWFLTTAGRTGLEVIGLNSNQVLCRMNDFVHVAAMSWSNGEF